MRRVAKWVAFSTAALRIYNSGLSVNKIPRHIILLITYETSLEFWRRKRQKNLEWMRASVTNLTKVPPFQNLTGLGERLYPQAKEAGSRINDGKIFCERKRSMGCAVPTSYSWQILTFSKIDHSSRFPRPKLKKSNLSPLYIRVLRTYHAKTACYELMGMSRAVAEAKNAFEQSEVDSLVDQHYALPRLFHDSFHAAWVFCCVCTSHAHQTKNSDHVQEIKSLISLYVFLFE